MKWKYKTSLLAWVGYILLPIGGLFCGYKLGRSTLPVIIVRAESREIVSNAHANVTESTFVGFTDSRGYSVGAFERAGGELPTILDAIIGEDSRRFFAYVLPQTNGFHLIIHHDNETPDLTEEQHQRLIERLRQILNVETSKSKVDRK